MAYFDLDPLLNAMLDVAPNISDLNLSVGRPPQVEIDGTLHAVPFDRDRLEVKGNGVPVQVGVWGQMTGEYFFALSERGTLVYRPAPPSGRRLVLVDLEGTNGTARSSSTAL